MIKSYFGISFILFSFLIVSCTHGPKKILTPTEERVVEASIIVEPEKPQASQESNSKTEEVEETEEVIEGVVFGKTDFQGLLKTSYVSLFVENLDNHEHKYQLIIGSKENQNVLPWKIKRVQPGYFYLQLPAGHYRISSIAIPVGNEQATEASDLRFEVAADKALYLGTLHINGTKQRIKFGGVPVIKPGFHYEVAISDEYSVAQSEFEQRFPEKKRAIQKKVMHILRKQYEFSDHLNDSSD